MVHTELSRGNNTGDQGPEMGYGIVTRLKDRIQNKSLSDWHHVSPYLPISPYASHQSKSSLTWRGSGWFCGFVVLWCSAYCSCPFVGIGRCFQEPCLSVVRTLVTMPRCISRVIWAR